MHHGNLVSAPGTLLCILFLDSSLPRIALPTPWEQPRLPRLVPRIQPLHRLR